MIEQFFIHRQYFLRRCISPVYLLFIALFLSSLPVFSQQKKSDFSARLMNVESVATTPFRYSTSLHNGRRVSQIYELNAKVPDGWMTTFNVQGSQVSALRLDSNKTQDISLEITASPFAKPGKYVIPVTAISMEDSLQLNLEAVIKGSYSLELSTPTGRLSDDITEGSSKVIQLVVRNTGTLPLKDIELSAQSPTQWSATFEPSKIDQLDAGQNKEITATLTVPDKTIAGDYVTTFTARNNNANANAAFRMTVKTSLLTGWIGIVVILVALGIVYYLIRKYGRR